MTNLDTLVPAEVLTHLSSEERDYLNSVFTVFRGYPTVEQIWQLMDEAWLALGCDPNRIDDRVKSFYRHPIWILNGLFIEQDTVSLEHRGAFKDWIVQQEPARVADFGGGFGSLARLVGRALPRTRVEVIEPHPHLAAEALAASTNNVVFVPELTGEYDLIVATDVFEHVPDPLGLCAETAAHLKLGGKYLIANCFHPVILCHLPQLFYFEFGWDPAMQAMGLTIGKRVQYGRAYQHTGTLNLTNARKIEERARRLYALIRLIPKGKERIGSLALKLFGKVD